MSEEYQEIIMQVAGEGINKNGRQVDRTTLENLYNILESSRIDKDRKYDQLINFASNHTMGQSLKTNYANANFNWR